MQVTVTQKYAKTSPKKLRAIVYSFKKLSPLRALEILPFTGKRGAEVLAKVIKSAIAAAKQKNLNETDLVFKEIQIGEGPRLKRWKAASRGRAKPFRRRMSHIRVVLTTRKSEVINPKSETREQNKLEIEDQEKKELKKVTKKGDK